MSSESFRISIFLFQCTAHFMLLDWLTLKTRFNVKINKLFSAIPFTALSKTHIQPFANLQPTTQQILTLLILCNENASQSQNRHTHTHTEFTSVGLQYLHTSTYITDTAVCLLVSWQQYLFDIRLLQYVQSWIPDVGRKDRPKHVQCYSNKINLIHWRIWLVLL